jgi:hypothetical protein
LAARDRRRASFAGLVVLPRTARVLDPAARRRRGRLRQPVERARALDKPDASSYAAAVTAKGFDATAMNADLVRIQSALQQMRKDQDVILKKLAAQRLAGEKNRAGRPSSAAQ